MRAALLTLTMVELLALTHSVSETFNCFDTPSEGRRCACIGVRQCDEMLKSGDCKSDPRCDNGELGAIVCSCKAVRTSNTTR